MEEVLVKGLFTRTAKQEIGVKVPTSKGTQ